MGLSKKKTPLSKIKNRTCGLRVCVCIYIYINFFIKNGLSKINKRLATKKT